MRGLVICQLAVTSKNMIEKIKKVATEEKDLYVQCESVSVVTSFDFSSFDVVLVAPQARNYLELVREKCKPFNIPVETIDIVAYGMNDAARVLKQMKTLTGQK